MREKRCTFTLSVFSTQLIRVLSLREAWPLYCKLSHTQRAHRSHTYTRAHTLTHTQACTHWAVLAKLLCTLKGHTTNHVQMHSDLMHNCWFIAGQTGTFARTAEQNMHGRTTQLKYMSSCTDVLIQTHPSCWHINLNHFWFDLLII